MRLSQSFRLQYTLVYTIAASVLVGLLMSITPAINAGTALWMHITGKTAVACGCAILPTTTHPLILVSVLLVSSILAFLTVRMIVSLILTIVRTRRTLSSWNEVYMRKMRFEHTSFTLHVVDLPYALLCSAGIFSAHIFVSTATLHTLTREELCAATLHEIGHVSKHHPLAYITFTSLCTALFLSRFSLLRAYHAFAHEASADTYALRFTSRAKLLSAITHFITSPQTLALPYFSLEESRIKILLGYDAPKPHGVTTLTLLSITCTTLMSLTPLTLFAQSDTLRRGPGWQGESVCAYVAPPTEEYLCIQDAGQTIILYQENNQ